MEELARELNRVEAALHHPKRPFVTVSYAQSIDGSIATRLRRPLPISGPGAMRMTHGLRALHDGILVGIETVLADDPQLSVRLVAGPHPQPVVLDTRLRTPLEARLLQRTDGRPWLVGAAGQPGRQGNGRNRCRGRGAALPAGGEQRPAGFDADPGSAPYERGIRRLMVEGGARVITSFIRAQLVDLFIITIAPKLVGGLQVMTAPPNASTRPPWR